MITDQLHAHGLGTCNPKPPSNQFPDALAPGFVGSVLPFRGVGPDRSGSSYMSKRLSFSNQTESGWLRFKKP